MDHTKFRGRGIVPRWGKGMWYPRPGLLGAVGIPPEFLFYSPHQFRKRLILRYWPQTLEQECNQRRGNLKPGIHGCTCLMSEKGKGMDVIAEVR